MTRKQGRPQPPRTVARLRSEHAELDRRFYDLSARAREGDWSDLDEVWDDFADDLEGHFIFEERDVFPRLALEVPGGAAMVNRLVAQHDQIRPKIAELGVAIQLHQVRADQIDALVEQVRAHAQLESEQLYPWLRQAPREEAPAKHRAG